MPKYRVERIRELIPDGQPAVMEVEADEISMPGGLILFGNKRTIKVVSPTGEKDEARKTLELVAVFNMHGVLSVRVIDEREGKDGIA